MGPTESRWLACHLVYVLIYTLHNGLFAWAGALLQCPLKGHSAHPKRSKFPRSALRFLAMLLAAAASHWPCNDGI